MKNAQNNFIDGIGNTPLIKLKAASEITGCNIYGKAEYLNPGGSVKDRAALALIKDAQQKKLISMVFLLKKQIKLLMNLSMNVLKKILLELLLMLQIF